MDETNCQFVSSRGILKSCSVRSKQPQSDHTDISYIQPKNLKPYDTIYVCSKALAFFVQTLLMRIKTPFILVSGDSDKTTPDESLTHHFIHLTSNRFLIHWFCQNCTSLHPKITHIPIGLDYHTIANNPAHKWKIPGELSEPINQEEILNNIITQSLPLTERSLKIYTNVHLTPDRYNERTTALDTIPVELLEIQRKFLPRTHVWNNYTKHSFVLSPAGNGLDCHRTWEALVLGCIPIVKSNPMNDKLFTDLPVLIVQDWVEITQELLLSTLEKISNNHGNTEKLKLKYWTNMISSYKPS